MEVFGTLMAVLIVGATVAGIVFVLTRGRTVELTFASIVAAYANLMIAVSVVAVAAGAALLLKASFAEIGDRDFSYETTAHRTSASDPSDDDLREDIALGITFSAIGAVVLVTHVTVRRVVGPRVTARHRANLDRVLSLAMSGIGAIGFLIAGGIGLSELLRRTVLETDLGEFESPPQPGDDIGWAIVFLLLWIGFGSIVWRQFRGEYGAAEARGAPLG